MKIFFTSILLATSFFAFGQATINLKEDLVLRQTLVISNDITYNGNGFKIICAGCNPAVQVENGARVHFQDVLFPRVYDRWLSVKGGEVSNVTWNSNKISGFIRKIDE